LGGTGTPGVGPAEAIAGESESGGGERPEGAETKTQWQDQVGAELRKGLRERRIGA
jgi:hypothetical protein